ncbi:MAG: FHA domain-containing protein [Thermomicrobiales bacterium]|nr:FHA domain-containing protein [Thermomicrobiales bacterium]
MVSELPFEWFVLLLRVVFIFLLYFFVYQVIRVVLRELRVLASRGEVAAGAPVPSGALLVSDAGESNLRRGEVFDLEPVTVIGRHPRATIRVDSSFISSEHAQMSWEQDRWWVTDLRSTNGTYVNGTQIRVPTGIRPGDFVELGGVKFQLVP